MDEGLRTSHAMWELGVLVRHAFGNTWTLSEGIGAVGILSGWGVGSRAFKACITPPKGALGGACRTEVSGIRGLRGLRGKAKAAVGASWVR